MMKALQRDLSPLGFGGYRIHEHDPAHGEALRAALLSGCNLIDTSANYGDGSSERLIGRILGELEREGRLQRKDVVVVSKAGYVQGENLKLAAARAREGRPFEGMVEFSQDCWHCISPEFLGDQITRSLARLKLDRLDVLLLHNPEYYLKAGGSHPEYYRRIESAFGYLETEVATGRIGHYGISSNTFPEPRDSDDYTSLETIIEIAEKQGKGHHFAAIQFPFNLFEPGAVLEQNNSGKSVVELAQAKGLGTLVNRPLNAFHQHKLIRLADYPSHADRDIVGEFKEAMNRATALEAQYPGRELLPARNIAWGHIIRENFEKLADLDTWKSFLTYRVEPLLEEASGILGEHAEFRAWLRDYRGASDRLFEAVTVYLESQASVQSDRIAGMLDHLCPELATSPTLQQKAIRLYRSVPGMDCILVGMRQTRYVRELMNLQPPVDADSARRALTELSLEF